MNMHVNAPPLGVHSVASVTIVPVIVTDVSDPENPVPDTVTVSPTTPVVGDRMMLGVVSVNIAVALSKLPSAPVAFTVYGVGDDGPLIVTAQLKLPNDPTVAPHAPIVTPGLIVSVIARSGVNPVPETRTDTPLGPWVGVRVIAGVVIVNGAVALSKLPSDPVALTVYAVGDAAPLIVTVQPKLPNDVTVAPHVPIVAPLLIASVIVTPGVNPVPETTAETPLGPCVGVSASPPVVIVNGAVALSKTPSEPVAFTVYATTDADPVIVTVQLKLPDESVAGPQALTVAPLLIVSEIVTPGVNPVPDTPSDTPLGPCAGVSVTVGSVIVNAAVPLSKLPSDPVAATVRPPPEPLTVNVQSLNEPVPSAAHELADGIVAPPLIVNVIVTSGVNPLPEAVTVTPRGPWTGSSVSVGIVIVNGAVARSKLPSDPVAVTVYSAAVFDVTVNVQPVNAPVALTVHVGPAITCAPVPIANATVVSGVNPLPDAVIVTPLGP